MMSMMYQAYQNHMDLTAPWRTGAAAALKYLNLVPQGVSDRAFGRLSEGGAVLMPPGGYGFSARFAGVNDRFGVSWQLNLR